MQSKGCMVIINNGIAIISVKCFTKVYPPPPPPLKILRAQNLVCPVLIEKVIIFEYFKCKITVT